MRRTARSLLALSFALLCVTPALGANETFNAAAFEEKLKAAIERQQSKHDATEPVKSQLVKEAPEATISSGTGDISTTGLCDHDIDAFCAKVRPGELRLATCLSNQKTEEEKGNVEGKKLSDDCRKEMAAFKIDLGTNINMNIPLSRACAADSTKLCAGEDATDPGAVLACLRDQKTGLSETCSEEILKTQLEGSKDYRTDADLHAACKPDADSLCKNVKPGEGRIQDCLRNKVGQTSWDCQEELFRQEVENADDLRLSYRLIRKCMGDKQKFCPDIKPGGARAKDCLESHRDDAGFSAECKEEFESMMEARAADFRLDSELSAACASDIEDICGYERESMDNVGSFDALVIGCLQDFREELQTPKCKQQVKKLTERASQDIRFDEPLADACYEDRARLCVGVQPGSARVIRCLQDNREELSVECSTTLFDQEVRMAEDIDFKYPMKRACTSEIQKFCAGMEHGHARIIRCLQDNLEDESFSGECREEVTRDQIRSNQDYRLNYRLASACEKDVAALCESECHPSMGQSCGGRVLRCLTEKQDLLTSQECRDEVFYFEKMEVTDYRNDVILAEACRTDVDKLCKSVPKGQGRVHVCLWDNKDKLTEDCRREELKLKIIQSRDIRLRPKLNKLCSEEISVFCKDVKPGKGRVFKCLQENLAQPQYSQGCKEQVEQRSRTMAEDYRLDYGVSSACETDVDLNCFAEKSKAHGHAEVLKCLVQSYSNITEGCQTEMSRAVRMALWEYKPQQAFTAWCDADVSSICSLSAATTPKNRGVWSIGAVGRCLSRQLAEGKPLSPDCRRLVLAAAPKDTRDMFDSSMSAATIAAKVQELQKAAGFTTPLVNPEGSGTSFLTLTGWMALLALAALITVMVGSAMFAYRRFMGIDQPYTIVTKQGDV
ncbi:hypothetical protein WJX73_005342 [Symbiochloris irregularis]|uniref:Golgi apparatus protein 1 n=1 Tax=Symbiochloris irregularis TaxID=706552 RepID=A0AAW1NUD2_9CHLO